MTIVDTNLRLRAFWGGRRESVESLADRTRETLALFTTIGGELGRDFVHPETRTDVSEDAAALRSIIEGGFDRFASGEPDLADGTRYGFMQDSGSPATKPFIEVSFSVGNEAGSPRRPGNSIVIAFNRRSFEAEESYPNEQTVLPIAVDLTRALVRLWDPDCVVLDSSELRALQRRPRGEPFKPDIGYVTWIRESLAPGLSSASAAVNERVGEGTLLAVNLFAPTADDDAERLIVDVLNRDLVGPLPFVQETSSAS